MKNSLRIMSAALVLGAVLPLVALSSNSSAVAPQTSFAITGFSTSSEYMTPTIVSQVKAAERHIASAGAKSVTISPHTDAYGTVAFNKYIGHARAFAIKTFLISLLRKDHFNGVAISIAPVVIAGKPSNAAGIANARRVVISYVAGGTISGLIIGIPEASDVATYNGGTSHDEFVFPTIDGCSATQSCYWVSGVTAQLTSGGDTYNAVVDQNVTAGDPSRAFKGLSGGIRYHFENLPAGNYTVTIHWRYLDYNLNYGQFGTAPNIFGDYTLYPGNRNSASEVNGAPVNETAVNVDGCVFGTSAFGDVPVSIGNTTSVESFPEFFTPNWC